MHFNPPLISAYLQRRYKRFLADVTTTDGATLTIHCPNTGAMTACMVEGGECWYSTSENPKRKYPNTWEISSTASGDLVGVNSALANKLLAEALDSKAIPELEDYESYRREVKVGKNSRLDFQLLGSAKDSRPCYVEVKSMTLMREPGIGEFPDAVTVRGVKHLQELGQLARGGARAILFFCVQHTGIERVKVAEDIDPNYASALEDARDAGVEVIAYKAHVSPQEMVLERALPWVGGGEAAK